MLQFFSSIDNELMLLIIGGVFVIQMVVVDLEEWGLTLSRSNDSNPQRIFVVPPHQTWPCVHP
jgi:hypothetical protein